MSLPGQQHTLCIYRTFTSNYCLVIQIDKRMNKKKPTEETHFFLPSIMKNLLTALIEDRKSIHVDTVVAITNFFG